jgi:hypothetical protein
MPPTSATTSRNRTDARNARSGAFAPISRSFGATLVRHPHIAYIGLLRRKIVQ